VRDGGQWAIRDTRHRQSQEFAYNNSSIDGIIAMMKNTMVE
jgi:hypothetical protein